MRAPVVPSHRSTHLNLACALCWASLLLACGQGLDTEPLGLSHQGVIGGQPSPPAQNAVVAIIDKKNAWCTGVVVAPTLVLTARHFLFSVDAPTHLQCASDRTGAPIRTVNDPTQYSVLFGNQKSLATVARGIRVYGGSELDLCRNDIALLELDTPLTITPLPLRLDAAPRKSEAGTLVGWGRSKVNEPPGLGVRRLQRDLEVKAVGPTLLPLDNGGALKVDDGTFVTDEGGCFGDSGAPFISTDTGAVVGLLSTAEPLDPTSQSQANAFGECVGAHDVFRSLSAQSGWIRDAFASNEQAPWMEGLAQPAAAGESCKSDAECVSGRCASAGDMRFCSVPCESDACPQDLQCVGAAGKRLCVPQKLAKGSAASQSCSMGVSELQPAWATLAVTPLMLVLRRRRRYRLTK